MTPEQADTGIVGFMRTLLGGFLMLSASACLLFLIAGWRSWGKKPPTNDL
jgi:hypothetical protein